MTKKAIYFQNEFNPANAPAGTQCITYTKEDGFQFYDDGKITTVTSDTDKMQTNEIDKLTERITILETKVAGGILEDGDYVTITSVSSAFNIPEKTVTIYGKEMENTTTPVSGSAKEIFADNITANAEVALTGTVLLNVTNASISGDCSLVSTSGDVKVDTLSITANGGTVVRANAEKNLVINNYTTKGQFKTQTNQINVEYAEDIVINNAAFNAGGYNTIMIAQPTSTTQEASVPSSIVIQNNTFTNVTNNAINIDRTTDNANILINNCNFIDCSNPIRFRNYNYARGMKAVISGCIFNKWETNSEYEGAVILEDRYSYNEYIKDHPKPAADATSGITSGAWVSGLIEFAKIKAPFGPDKLTMTFENCKFPEGKPEYTSENISGYMGTEPSGRFAYIWVPGANATLEYDEKVYPKIEFK